MKKINDRSQVRQWGYHDSRLGRGFAGTFDHIAIQVQEAYLKEGVEFHEKEIPALIENYMCLQGLASPCSERIEGLGDIVHLAFYPFAKATDAVLGTRYAKAQGCPNCKKRREELNQAFPL